MSRKDKQHVVPRTYLKQWRIADNKSFVYGIDSSNKYRKGVQTFGLNDKVFKRKRYYNSASFRNSYIIEDVLGEDIEPVYNRIMDEINRENNLSRSARSDIMLWLYVSKMRSPSIRDNFEQLSNFFLKTTERYKNRSISHNREEEIKDYARASAKNIHLGLTMSIRFVQASLEHIDYINRGVFYTRNNIVISNRRDTLEYCIKHR